MSSAPDPAFFQESGSFDIPDVDSAEFDQWVDSIQGELSPETPDEPDEEEPEEESTDSDEEGDEEVSSPPVESIEINGEEIPKEELVKLWQLSKQIQQPTPTPPPLPPAPQFVPPTPPDSVDLDDPGMAAMWNRLVDTEKAAWETRQLVQSQHQEQLNRQAKEDLAIAIAKFKSVYPQVTEEEITQLRSPASLLVPGLMATHPPVDALMKSLMMAGFDNEAIRNKMLAITTPTRHDISQRRKRKQSSLTSSSGSTAPRTEQNTRFRSDREAINQMAKEIESSFASNGGLN